MVSKVLLNNESDFADFSFSCTKGTGLLVEKEGVARLAETDCFSCSGCLVTPEQSLLVAEEGTSFAQLLRQSAHSSRSPWTFVVSPVSFANLCAWYNYDDPCDFFAALEAELQRLGFAHCVVDCAALSAAESALQPLVQTQLAVSTSVSPRVFSSCAAFRRFFVRTVSPAKATAFFSVSVTKAGLQVFCENSSEHPLTTTPRELVPHLQLEPKPTVISNAPTTTATTTIMQDFSLLHRVLSRVFGRNVVKRSLANGCWEYTVVGGSKFLRVEGLSHATALLAKLNSDTLNCVLAEATLFPHGVFGGDGLLYKNSDRKQLAKEVAATKRMFAKVLQERQFQQESGNENNYEKTEGLVLSEKRVSDLFSW